MKYWLRHTSDGSIDLKAASALGMGNIAIFLINNAVAILALPYYQMTLGLDPFLLSIAITVPLFISAMIGPWVGYYSDHFKSRFGRRKPFIFLSSILCGIFYGLMWEVPLDWSEINQFIYLFSFTLLFFISSTFLAIPLQCLTFESSDRVEERTKVIAITVLFRRFTAMTAHWIYPLSTVSLFGGAALGVQFVGWFVGLCFITGVSLIAVLFSHEAEAPELHDKPEMNVIPYIQKALKNRVFLLILLISFLQVCGGGFSASMDYYVLVYYVSAGVVADGAILKGVLSSAHAITGMTLIPVVTYITLKFGQRRALEVAFGLATLGGIAKWFIFAPGAGWTVAFDAILCNMVWVIMGITIPAIIASICDEERRLTQEDNKGVYMAVHHWVLYLGASIAVLASGFTLSFIGFDANFGADQPPSSLFSMRLILAAGTSLFAIIAFLLSKKLRLHD